MLHRMPPIWECDGARMKVSEGHSQDRTTAQDDSSLDQILKLADVPGPVVLKQGIHRLGRDALIMPFHACGELHGKMPHQQRDVLATLTQRRNSYRENMQSVEEIGPESLLLNHGGQIA